MSRRDKEYTDAMTKVLSAAERVAVVNQFLTVAGGGIGMAARIFALPWLAIYAWNGMTTLPDWPYWPTVAAFVVVSILLTTVRGPRK